MFMLYCPEQNRLPCRMLHMALAIASCYCVSVSMRRSRCKNCHVAPLKHVMQVADHQAQIRACLPPFPHPGQDCCICSLRFTSPEPCCIPGRRRSNSEATTSGVHPAMSASTRQFVQRFASTPLPMPKSTASSRVSQVICSVARSLVFFAGLVALFALNPSVRRMLPKGQALQVVQQIRDA